MILKEFTSKNTRKFEKLNRALAENYDYDIDFDSMTMKKASKMSYLAKNKINETQDLNKRVKLKMIAESLDLWMQANIQTELTDMVAEGIDDDSMEEAKVILAAKELSDNIQGMIEDAAKMQVQDLLPIVDAMRSEIGSAEADAFSTAAEAALASLVEVLKTSKKEYDDAIGVAQGQAPSTDMDDFGDEMDVGDTDGEIGIDDVDMDAMDDEFDDQDEFAGDDANMGGANPTGRELKDEN